MADDNDIVINPNPVITVDGKKPHTTEIASAATDVDMFQGWLPVMENTDRVLTMEGGGNISIYDEIGRDPRVAASLRTRAKAVTGRDWHIVPFSQEARDIQIAEYVENVFTSFAYDRARRSILRGGVLKGYSVAEVMWDYSEGDTFIKSMLYRHQRRFRFAPNSNLHLMTLGNPYPGIDVTIDATTGLPLRKFQIFTFGDEVTTPYGNGLGQELYWPWWFKKNGIKFWLIFIEKFAAPTAAGEYADGTDPTKQQELLAAAASLHSNSAVIYPAGMNLKLIEAARGGSVSGYKELCDFMNEEMTISILGQTATTSGRPGGLGNADEQQQVLEDYLKDDGDSLCEAQNDRISGCIPWLVDYQFPGTKCYPKIEIKTTNEEDSKTLAERDNNLTVAMERSGLRLSKSYYVRTHGLQDDDVEGTQTAPILPVPKDNIPTGVAISFAEGETPFPGEAEIDALAESFGADDLQGLIEGPLKPLFNLIQQGGNLIDLMDDLVKLFPEMNTDTLQDMLARMIFVAEVWGRLQEEE
jgi:phage gp29-like protein